MARTDCNPTPQRDTIADPDPFFSPDAPPMRLSSLICLPLLLASLSTAALAADRPNVLFIISDDLTAESLGCYGNEVCQTPHIDSLANRGLRFNQAYCQYPVCGPSRAALMSGMYSQCVGVVGNGSSERFTDVLGERPSMTQHFKDHGYHAARVSKIYHMRIPGDITAGVHGPDHAASWSERHSFKAPEWMSEGEHEHLSKENLKRDPDKHYSLGFGGAFYVVKTSTDGSEQCDVLATDKALDIMRAHKDGPFFMAVGLIRPHVPLVAPKSYFDPYAPEGIEPPTVPDGDWDDIPKPGRTGTSQQRGLTTLLKKQKAISAYYASVAFMDAQVGRLLDGLKEMGLDENTIVVFTSDHGWHLGEHDFWQKMSLHEESTRIPLVFAGPDIPSGSRQALAEQIDIYPTLADLCGLPIPEHVLGKSLVPVFKERSTILRKAAYSFRGNAHLIRTSTHAYIRYQDGSEELYDMWEDPDQFTNLAGESSAALTEARALLDEKLKLIKSRSPRFLKRGTR